MTSYTPNHNFGKKASGDEHFDDATHLGGNWDKADAALAGKVDKVTGKQLSTEDYTSAEKSKLSGIPADTAAQLGEIEAKSLKIKNEVVNGDFSDGTIGWIGVLAHIAVVNGVLTKTPTGSSSRIIPSPGINIVIGDKYYYSHDVKTNSKSVEIYTTNPVVRSNLSSGSGQFEKLSLTHTASSNPDIRFAFSGADSSNPVDVKNVQAINLTQTFGAGNEPTKSEMDTLINLIGWFDGEISVTEKQLAIWTLNLIRQNRNAIISLGGTII